MQRIFAIGDIHGCYDKLRELIRRIPIDWQKDQLVFIGDYIDRGPDSFRVVDYLIELKRRVPGIIFLRGNHEDMLIDYLDGRDRLTYLYNGGQQTLESYLNHSGHVGDFPIPTHHIEFFRSLVLYHETDDYIFVHAGLKKNVPLQRQDPQDMLWIREKFTQKPHAFGKRIVFGHTPYEKPLVTSDKIGIDTGAVFGNMLTCVQLPEEIFYHA